MHYFTMHLYTILPIRIINKMETIFYIIVLYYYVNSMTLSLHKKEKNAENEA